MSDRRGILVGKAIMFIALVDPDTKGIVFRLWSPTFGEQVPGGMFDVAMTLADADTAAIGLEMSTAGIDPGPPWPWLAGERERVNLVASIVRDEGPTVATGARPNAVIVHPPMGTEYRGLELQVIPVDVVIPLPNDRARILPLVVPVRDAIDYALVLRRLVGDLEASFKEP